MKNQPNSSRSANVARNMVVGILCQIFNSVISFISRSVFIYILGTEYLGVNGLFSNILTVLSFAELGIGNAIVFSMYKPLADGDKDKLSSMMLLYKKAYMIIGIAVAVAGCCAIPFLTYLVDLEQVQSITENIVVLYLLFLSNTVLSYFLTYKKSMIIVDQKEYIVTYTTEIVKIITVILQIVLLLITNQYILYLLLQTVGTLISNIILSVTATRMYPFLKGKATPLPKAESKAIFSNIKALAIYKFGSVILNGTDNILVSALDSVATVGIISNYTLLTSTCNLFLNKITSAFTASVGNLNVNANPKKQIDIFYKIFFITVWIYGFASVGLCVVQHSFISNWIGSEYVLDKITMFAIIMSFYVNGVHHAAYVYRTTLGYFIQGKMAPILAAIINIILSVALYKLIGLAGVFIATPIARILTMGIFDPVLIYKRTFHQNPLQYYVRYALYLALVAVMGLACFCCVSVININGWLGVVAEIAVVTVVYNGLMLLVFHRTKMFKEIKESVLHLLKRR